MVGWIDSANAWIAAQGDDGAGDFTRRYITDPAMLARIRRLEAKTALDIGCGEGRFCRALADEGIATTGIDPTPALLAAARSRHPLGTYVEADAADLPFEDESYDLAVSYFTLIDIEDAEAAIREMARILKPGGSLLITNTSSLASAHISPQGWVRNEKGVPLHFALDHYLDTRSHVESWAGIMVENWHRPLRYYFAALLQAGLQLTHFDEPEPLPAAPADKADRYRRAPWALVMEWQKPLARTAATD